VRLGEGLAVTGQLSEAAMARTLEAVSACKDKLAKRSIVKMRSVATQACRAARNGQKFLAHVRKLTGVRFDIIEPGEEARLAVLGCADLIAPSAKAALVVDIGGGSTELSWAVRPEPGRLPRLQAYHSAPIGVVTLADRFPEHDDPLAWYQAMKAEAAREIAAFSATEDISAALANKSAHIIGTSGAITSLAGVHMGLARYSRRAVDGVWIGQDDTRAAIARLSSLSRAARASEPCIGHERADLVLAGAAILDAVMDAWPSETLRVADRGLREGLILSMLNKPRKRRRRKRS
jgi:exopolyphosphatase / guanosine-5'-triphosphate,3'-diphosphate pyrophosphatase